MTTNTSVVGKAVYGNQGGKKNFANAGWQISENGSHFYRILPPFGLLAAKGQWAKFEAVHWGFKGTDGKMKPFRCIQRTKKNRNGMVDIIVECKQCTKIAEKKAQYDNAVKKYVSEGKTQEEAWKLCEPMKPWLDRYNLDRHWTVNALRPEDNQIGKLKIKLAAKKELDERIKYLQEKKGIEDPLDPETGVLFDFQRTGEGRYGTKYPVAVAMETVKVDGEEFEKIRRFPLTKEVLKRMETEAFELSNSYVDLTHEQIALLASSNGDPSIVDSVFGAGTVSKSEPEFDAPPEEDDEMSPPVETKSDSKPAEEVDPDEAALMAQLKAYRAKKAGSPSSTNASVAKPVTKSSSDDDAYIDSLMEDLDD